MRRGKITFSGASWVAYDYTTLYKLTKVQRFLLKHFPTLYFGRPKPNPAVIGELTSFLKDRRSVEIIFWEPRLANSKVAKRLFKRVVKQERSGEAYIRGLEYPAKHCQTLYEITKGNYDRFFTNRVEVTPYFNPSFVCYTQVDAKVDFKRLTRVSFMKRLSKYTHWKGIK